MCQITQNNVIFDLYNFPDPIVKVFLNLIADFYYILAVARDFARIW